MNQFIFRSETNREIQGNCKKNRGMDSSEGVNIVVVVVISRWGGRIDRYNRAVKEEILDDKKIAYIFYDLLDHTFPSFH